MKSILGQVPSLSPSETKCVNLYLIGAVIDHKQKDIQILIRALVNISPTWHRGRLQEPQKKVLKMLNFDVVMTPIMSWNIIEVIRKFKIKVIRNHKSTQSRVGHREGFMIYNKILWPWPKSSGLVKELLSVVVSRYLIFDSSPSISMSI